MSEQSDKDSRQGLVPFLAGIDDFRRLIDTGHTRRSIYDNHKAQLGMSYSQFTRYISKYLPQSKKPGYLKQDDQKDQEPASQLSPSTSRAKPPLGVKPPYFHHDPSSGNDRQDLI